MERTKTLNQIMAQAFGLLNRLESIGHRESDRADRIKNILNQYTKNIYAHFDEVDGEYWAAYDYQAKMNTPVPVSVYAKQTEV